MPSRTLLKPAFFAALLPFCAACAGEGTASPGLEAVVDSLEGVERLSYPEDGATIPPVNRLLVDHLDRVWVGVSEEVPGENERLDVYAGDGQLLGEMRGSALPDLFFGNGYAAVISEETSTCSRS